jgi:hypothetical protein
MEIMLGLFLLTKQGSGVIRELSIREWGEDGLDVICSSWGSFVTMGIP